MKKHLVLALALFVFASPSFSLTVFEARNGGVLEALDQVKKDVPDLTTKKLVRTLRNEIQGVVNDADDDLQKAEAIRAPYDSILPGGRYRVFKGKTDTSTISKYNRAYFAWATKNVPLLTKVPIAVSLQDDALGRVVDGNWDVLLKDLIQFNGLEDKPKNTKTKKGG